MLRGEIVDSQYVISGDNEGRSCIYEVSYTGEDSIIVDTGRKCSLHEISKKVWSPGQKYVVDKGVFHESSVALNQSAVTFVCLSHKGDEPPLVVGDAAGGSFPYDRAAFEGEEFWSNVNESLAELMIRPDVNY
uniref:hypothetical protein n=1 Tax=Xanthomonas sp. 0924 TaxID=2835534 RepID=UPI003F7E6721